MVARCHCTAWLLNLWGPQLQPGCQTLTCGVPSFSLAAPWHAPSIAWGGEGLLHPILCLPPLAFPGWLILISPGASCRTTVLGAVDMVEDTEHPAPYPVKLFSFAARAAERVFFSLNPAHSLSQGSLLVLTPKPQPSTARSMRLAFSLDKENLGEDEKQ